MQLTFASPDYITQIVRAITLKCIFFAFLLLNILKICFQIDNEMKLNLAAVKVI